MRARRDGNDWMKGEWGLIKCNDPTFRWTLTPTPNPTWGMTEEEEEAWDANVEKGSPEENRSMWPMFSPDEYDAFTSGFFECGANTGYDLITAAMKVGYNPDDGPLFPYWFFDYLGEWLKTAEIVEEGDPFPNREEFAPSDLTIGRE